MDNTKKVIDIVKNRLSNTTDICMSDYNVISYVDDQGSEIMDVYYNINNEFVCTEVYIKGNERIILSDEQVSRQLQVDIQTRIEELD